MHFSKFQLLRNSKQDTKYTVDAINTTEEYINWDQQ